MFHVVESTLVINDQCHNELHVKRCCFYGANVSHDDHDDAKDLDDKDD